MKLRLNQEFDLDYAVIQIFLKAVLVYQNFGFLMTRMFILDSLNDLSIL